MKKPNLFIVGEPRSGTTSLFHYLKQHPEIYMCAIKEPHYFASDFHKEHDLLHPKKFAFPIRSEEEKNMYLLSYYPPICSMEISQN